MGKNFVDPKTGRLTALDTPERPGFPASKPKEEAVAPVEVEVDLSVEEDEPDAPHSGIQVNP